MTHEIPAGPLTEAEIARLRKRMLDEDHAAWAWRLSRRWIAYIGGFITAAWALYEWIGKHVRFHP